MMNKIFSTLATRRVALVALFLAIAALLTFWQSSRAQEVSADASLVAFLSGEENSAGFARAVEADNVRFPADLGPHNEYQTEWWYYTGNLETDDGRPFGFQFTIFRRALTPTLTVNDNAWRSNQLYFAHFTISDIANDAFYPHERFSRGAAGLAGAQSVPYRVWLEDWSVTEVAPGQVRLLANAEDVALDLLLTETLPPVLHGDGGLSRKGASPGNASYYYSIVQQQASGTVRLPGERLDVSGLAWKDHEYSTSVLEGDAIGWDWFSLQLDDGSALMFFNIRNADGTLDSFSSGSFIAADGTVTDLALGDWTLAVTDRWTSPTSGGTYPAGWEISVPALDLTLRGAPLMANQELNVSTVYWEGAVAFEGLRGDRPVTARGYIEMTGYGGSLQGRL